MSRQWKRTHTCGELRKEHVAQEVTLNGWVHRRRDHGGVVFIDVRDRYGLTQVVIDPQASTDVQTAVTQVRNEFVLSLSGTVQMRPDGTRNPNLPTGDIEVHAADLQILSATQTPPFDLNNPALEVDEAIRLRYRYLDLRREDMQRKMELRHRLIKAVRDFMDAEGFWEIETPILLKSTPEGARDYLVPSRVHPGRFYALPQSPQQLKQLLMVSGMDRYFQIARCFRDEDPRADRQPEFTQLDVEMAFVERDDVMGVIERLYLELADTLSDKTVQSRPIPRIPFAEAMEKYGCDTPDLRFGLELVDVSGLAQETDFRVFKDVVAKGGIVKGVRVPGCAHYSRKQIDEFTDLARSLGGKGLVSIALDDGQVRSPVLQHLGEEAAARIARALSAEAGDLVLIVADQPDVTNAVLSRLRLEIGDRLGLRDPNTLAFCWLVDFPLFEWDEEEGRWSFVHNPFCGPFPEDEHLITSDPGSARSLQYDLVCNGWEIGGGSVRAHKRELLEQIWLTMGFTKEQIDEQIGHMLEAFSYGVPPHGGIAMGLDRTIAIFADVESIRETIAFPKNQQAIDIMTQAPSPVSDAQLEEVHLALRNDKE
ncbi:MAG: aspartate--tRNA ligase [Chloroflexota bacterium]|nr:aspartate--tRNA ligase [Chloroflexota bacterium]